MPASAVSLNKHALSAEKSLEQLATGLAQAGAEEGAIKAVGQMADAVRKIAESLTKAAEQTPAPEQRPTMDSATDEMMAERSAPPA